MFRRSLLLAALLASILVAPAAPIAGATTPGTSSNFQLVGHDALFTRGMNAALAIFSHFVYVGSRTDGSDTCAVTGTTGCPHVHPGVQIVDVADPTNPHVVGQIGPPDEGTIGQTSRELRVWPQQKLLLVMNFRCSPFLHACADTPFPGKYDIKFYDLTDPVHPKLISTYVPSRKPHEMFLWVDPTNAKRALLYTSNGSGTRTEVVAADISGARRGKFTEIAKFSADDLYTPDEHKACGLDIFVHSLSISPDGTRGYLAYWCGNFLVVDTSDLANNVKNPVIRLITPVPNRPTWPNPHGHSAVKIPGKPFVISTDEVYGNLLTPFDPPAETDGCPWGWARSINISDPTHPFIAAEYKIAENQAGFCSTAPSSTFDRVSFATHNLTVLPDVAFIAWHSGGLQAVNIADPASPTTAGFFVPQPLTTVATEDPALSACFDINKNPGCPTINGVRINSVVMWSYPIIKNGLIYVVDIRNGLYILRFTGANSQEVRNTGFLEGNSNLGDAVKLEPVTG